MSYNIEEHYRLFLIAITTTSLGFVFYYYVLYVLKDHKIFQNKQEPSDNLSFILFKRSLGFVIFGLLPVSLISLWADIDLYFIHFDFQTGLFSFRWILILSLIIIPLNFFVGSNEQNLMQYPEIRKREWSFMVIVLSTVSWIFYLLSYELLFRGILLFSAYELMGFWPAVLLNVIMYVLVHIPKGLRESLGSVPLGLVLCYLAIATGSFWIAFFIHLLLALSNEWFSVKFHPEIKLYILK